MGQTQNEWYKKNKQKCKESASQNYYKDKTKHLNSAKKWWKLNPERHALSQRKSFYKRNFRLTLEEVEKLFGKLCPICKNV